MKIINRKNSIKKALILAAGWGTRFLPLTKVIHKELVPVLNKPIIHYLVEEAVASGIEEIILVISPRKLDILRYFTINVELENELKKKDKVTFLKLVRETNNLVKITVAIQNEQLGLGHAIITGADLLNNEPFAVILGDDLIDAEGKPALKQLIEAYNKHKSSIIGVQSVEINSLHRYGVIKPHTSYKEGQRIFEIIGAVEKPPKGEAPSNKAIMGRYIFTPEILKILRELKLHPVHELDVVDAFEELMKSQKIYACHFEGKRYDLGSIEGFVKANIDFALKDQELGPEILKFITNKKI